MVVNSKRILLKKAHFLSFTMSLYTKNPVRLKNAVITSAKIAEEYFPSPSALPLIVEVIAEGMRPKNEIIIHVERRISVSPAKYTSKSFGVPGAVNIMANIMARLDDE